MAYCAILVDDEYWILEGLLRVFPWAEYGFEVVARFMDAEEALAYMHSNPVDLVLSDIRMPGFTGLDLLEASRLSGHDAEFLMISGYSEFEYAAAALRHNALDYCLKPVKREDAAAALRRARARIDKKRDAQNRAHLSRARREGGAASLLRELRPDADGEAVMAILSRGEGAFLLRDWAHSRKSAAYAALYCQDECLCVARGTSEQLAAEVEALRAALSQAQGSVGVSGIASPGPEEDCVTEADMASWGRFVQPNEHFFAFSDTGGHALESLVVSFQFAIRNSDLVLARQVLARVPVLFAREALGVYHAQQLWNRFALCVPGKGGGALLPLYTYENLTSRFENISAMCASIADLLAHRPVREEPQQDDFVPMYEYVRNHYCKKISISDLTKRFYMNPTYCSELFKNRTGSTFSEFVTRLRMERAGEMMRNGEGSLQDIACATGYPDYFYFSKTFKKYFGISPTKYMQSSVR